LFTRIRIGINAKLYKAHSLAWIYMTGEIPRQITDHINHNTSDNRWINLRAVSHADNLRNMSRRKDNASGATGVDWSKAKRKWRARIKVNGVDLHIGFFDRLVDATIARKEADRKHGFHANHGAQNAG